MALSLVSINIEWDKHLDTVIPFLTETQPDVVCVQELLDADIPLFEKALRATWYGAALIQHERREGTRIQYNAIFSRYPLTDTVSYQYAGTEGALSRYSEEPATWGTGREKGMLVGATITKDEVPYRIFTTHFTWTRNGESTPEQQEHMKKVLALLEKEEPLVLCGDFNAPRGGTTFSMLAEKYQDTIPAEYETSLDLAVHKARETARDRISRYMVDGLFTSAGYRAHNVKLQFGVSDHGAIVATIEKS